MWNYYRISFKEHNMKHLSITFEPNEYWYGVGNDYGREMPFSAESTFKVNCLYNFTGNSEAPFLVSTSGRYVWSDIPFAIDISGGKIELDGGDDLELHTGFGNLRDAYLDACHKYFSPTGELPAENFFKKPQYNTWSELIYDQNQKDVLKYAHGIIDNGLPAGIIMIDDNWNCYYGKWEFNRATFPDPKTMVDELHSMGFEVMLWIAPFISPDSAEFRDLLAKNCLVKDKNGVVAIRKWWNGYSAVLDLSNPDGFNWFLAQTAHLMNDYGIDGFKLDACDPSYYRDDDQSFVPEITAHEQGMLWNKIGMHFKYNEYRGCFRGAGLPLVHRLRDKGHHWRAVQSLIPLSLPQGILGYANICPDMIGGGSFVDFLPGAPNLDPEIFVRYAQCSALLPMMQYSAAPWRVLPKEYADLCVKAGELHIKYSDKIFELAKEASVTGEPIVRYMEYVYPHKGYATITDQFMLGNDILVAPVVDKGMTEKEVVLPEGKWIYCDGTVYEGGCTVKVPAPIDCLPYFEKA